MSKNNGSAPQIPINLRTFAASNSSVSREDAKMRELFAKETKKLQDDLRELGLKMKHYEDSVRFLRDLKSEVDYLIHHMQASLGFLHHPLSTPPNKELSHVKSEQEIIECIIKHEKSAASALFTMSREPGFSPSFHPYTKHVLGVVATLGRFKDETLSRILSEYLGQETMFAIVCTTYEGAKALEVYKGDGSIDITHGLHAYAASKGRSLDRFRVICLENLRPYAGDFMPDDPQMRLDILKPTLPNGEIPPGFLGFAVNMISIENSNLYFVSKSGLNLRETLFYHLFSKLQVYKSREDMRKALPLITHGAVSLDGGMIRYPGDLIMGLRGDIDIKFPIGSFGVPEDFSILLTQLKETTWKRNRICDDLNREQAQLDLVTSNYEKKKLELVDCIHKASLHSTPQVWHVSTRKLYQCGDK